MDPPPKNQANAEFVKIYKQLEGWSIVEESDIGLEIKNDCDWDIRF